MAPIAPTIKENTPTTKYTQFNSEAKGINTIVFNFINAANKANTGTKLKYAATILESLENIPTKFVKKLSNTYFYELRISVDNEIRIILFSIDNDNINLSTRILFLNGFIKKSTKDYKREINKAETILRRLL